MSETKGFADEVVSVDQLGLDKYCKGLGEFILGCDTPMTISIQGKWGSGKSSIFNITKDGYLQKEIDAGKLLFIRFDTWMYCKSAASGNLTFLLMNQLYNHISDAVEDKGKKGKDTLKNGFGLTKEALLLLSDAIAGGRVADKVEEVLEVLTNSEKQLNEAQALLAMKTAMAQKIKKVCEDGPIKRRIVVFVDDLDRLDPVIAVELLEGIKSFLDCKHCVFVLAIDNSVVYDGVYQKYNLERGVEEHDQKAYSFFDKIIQVPFSMPYGVYAVDTYIKPFLGEEANPFTYQTLIRRHIPDNNPRAIKRVFSLYSLNQLILDGRVKTGEEKLCLFLVTLLQVVNNNFYLELIANLSRLEEFLAEDNANTNNFNHDLIIIAEAAKQNPEDDDDEMREELLRILETMFANTEYDPFDAVRRKLVEAGVIVSPVDEKTELYSLANKKLCRISEKGENKYNMTVYGKAFIDKMQVIAEANGVNKLVTPNSHITMTDVDGENRNLIGTIFDTIIEVIQKSNSN